MDMVTINIIAGVVAVLAAGGILAIVPDSLPRRRRYTEE